MEEKEYKYMVAVQCMTYNQSKYILDALNGFVMQQTNFPFVVMVVDDASTDGEQEVIAKFISEQFDTTDSSVAYEKETDYAHISYAQHKINKNCYIAALYLKENHYSQRKAMLPYLADWRDYVKYEALCEGDDYWIQPKKLQMQVDFLDGNSEYSFTAHRCMVFDETHNKWSEYNDVSDYKKNPSGIIIDFKYSKYITHTATLLFRTEALSEYHKFVNNGGPGFDFILIYFLKKAGKGFCFNIKMSVYRLNIGGIYGKQSVYTKLFQGYDALKKLHSTENNSITRKMYYSRYASIFVASKGGIFLQENFEILKFLSMLYFLPVKILRLLVRKFTK